MSTIQYGPIGSEATSRASVDVQPWQNTDIGLMANSTALLAEPERLRARLATDGYLYIHEVVDRGVVDEIRAEMIAVLAERGFVEQVNGAWEYAPSVDESLVGSRLPVWLDVAYRERGLLERVTTHQPLVQALTVIAGEEIDFLPVSEFRSRPPDDSVRFAWHQDGFYTAPSLIS